METKLATEFTAQTEHPAYHAKLLANSLRPMSKAATKRSIRALPALRASLIWFKRETVRQLQRKADGAVSPRLRVWLAQKARKVATTDLADLRLAYQAARVAEIRTARRFELSRAIPGIVWLSA